MGTLDFLLEKSADVSYDEIHILHVTAV